MCIRVRRWQNIKRIEQKSSVWWHKDST